MNVVIAFIAGLCIGEVLGVVAAAYSERKDDEDDQGSI